MRTIIRTPAIPAVLLSATMLAGCATYKPPQISYDASVPPLPAVPAVVTDDRPRPIHIPPAWTVARGGTAAGTPTARVENANAAARVEPGESLTGAGPIAAGDTARWIIGDTESGSGVTRRVHILVKPSRPDITTNLVVTTDRRVYMLELRSGEKPYMPAVAWAYPQQPAGQRQAVPATPVIPAVAARNYRYGLTGDNPAWKPVAVYDDGRRVYVEFPRGIVQGEMPPIFVLGADGEAQIVNSRIHQHILIVDRLFGAAELRLGSGDRQQTVRIVRTDGRPSS